MARLAWSPVSVCFLALPSALLGAQSVEERLAALEREVAELRALHGLAEGALATAPAELVGNVHIRWGYPGGTCLMLVREFYAGCYDAQERVSDQWPEP
jgi:hypothetical protein